MILHDDDKDLDINVQGDIIGKADSFYDGALRWTSVTIYRTPAGNYVVHKQGLSKVYHTLTGCKTKAKTHDVATERQWRTLIGKPEKKPCTVCRPSSSDTVVRIEQQRSSVHICTAPEGVTESLLSQDNEGVTYMNRTAATALKRASQIDPSLKVVITVD